MFVVVARYHLKEGVEERALELLKSVAPLARAEPGCLTYTINQSLDDPRLIVMFERFVDEAAFRAHAAAPYVQEIVVGQLLPLIERRERELFAGVEP